MKTVKKNDFGRPFERYLGGAADGALGSVYCRGRLLGALRLSLAPLAFATRTSKHGDHLLQGSKPGQDRECKRIQVKETMVGGEKGQWRAACVSENRRPPPHDWLTMAIICFAVAPTSAQSHVHRQPLGHQPPATRLYLNQAEPHPGVCFVSPYCTITLSSILLHPFHITSSARAPKKVWPDRLQNHPPCWARAPDTS